MRNLLQRCLALLMLMNGSAFAAQIEAVPAMGISGLRTFSASPTIPGETIRWSADRITKSEKDGSGEQIKEAVYTATGPQAFFKLDKISGKQTIWRIRASDSGGTDQQDVQVFQADRMSSFTFDSPGNPVTRVYLIAPATMNADSKMMVLMHASMRENHYCNYWQKWAARYNTLLICPEFTQKNWPDSLAYQRGYVFEDEENTILRPESKWSYTVLDQVQKYARNGFALKDEYYDIWGHSGGSQFIQRFMFFKPAAKIRLAMAANSGWYMMPSMNIDYACGGRHPQLPQFNQAAMAKYSQRNAIIFSGTRDTDPKGPDHGGCMDLQGLQRYERAGYFHTGLLALFPNTTWKKIDVLNVGHDGKKMAYAAQAWMDLNVGLAH